MAFIRLLFVFSFFHHLLRPSALASHVFSFACASIGPHNPLGCHAGLMRWRCTGAHLNWLRAFRGNCAGARAFPAPATGAFGPKRRINCQHSWFSLRCFPLQHWIMACNLHVASSATTNSPRLTKINFPRQFGLGRAKLSLATDKR